jgi:hypothetical protein
MILWYRYDKARDRYENCGYDGKGTSVSRNKASQPRCDDFRVYGNDTQADSSKTNQGQSKDGKE